MYKENREDVLYLFHHIHHIDGKHAVHHCGGEHRNVDKNLNYTIMHCACGKHSIDTQNAIGHANNKNIKKIEIIVSFSEKCPDGGWHIESGKKI